MIQTMYQYIRVMALMNWQRNFIQIYAPTMKHSSNSDTNNYITDTRIESDDPKVEFMEREIELI